MVFPGILEEMRISNVARSAYWIATEYHNQSSPSTFYSIASADGGGTLNPFISSFSKTSGDVAAITNVLTSSRSQNFCYDMLNRITKAQTTSTYGTSTANCWSELYTDDAWGNLITIAQPSGTYPTNPYGGCVQESGFSISVNSSNQDTGSCYDAAGNKVGSNPGTCSPLPTTYAYNAENQLTSTAGVTYTYDGDGKRVQKSSGTLYWYGTRADPLMETNGSGSLTDEYIFFGGKRIARRDSSSNVDYYFADHLGTARVVTNSSGAVQDDSDFYPYGVERSVTGPSSGNKYKFTAKERDSESNLDNFGARYFSSQYGRFMTPDWSAKPQGVPYANFSDPQTLNLYSYVRDNPLSRADIDGHNFGDGINCSANSPGAGCQAISNWNAEHGVSSAAWQRSGFSGNGTQQTQTTTSNTSTSGDPIVNALYKVTGVATVTPTTDRPFNIGGHKNETDALTFNSPEEQAEFLAEASRTGLVPGDTSKNGFGPGVRLDGGLHSENGRLDPFTGRVIVTSHIDRFNPNNSLAPMIGHGVVDYLIGMLIFRHSNGLD